MRDPRGWIVDRLTLRAQDLNDEAARKQTEVLHLREEARQYEDTAEGVRKGQNLFTAETIMTIVWACLPRKEGGQ